MAYRKRLLDEPQTAPPLDALRGRQLMRRDRASSIHATGDRVLSHGRRILTCVGLHGAEKWHVPDTAVSGFSHPNVSAARVVARTPTMVLTPGHFVRATVVADPSGLTSKVDGFGAYVSAGAKGQIKIDVTYDNGGSVTVTKTISVPASGLANAAQPTGDGAAWSALSRHRPYLFLPAVPTPPNLAAWMEGVRVSVVVSYVGSPRAVDVVVYEEPLALAYDLAAGDWIAPMHADGDGHSLGELDRPVPLVKQSASDPGGGAEIVADAASRVCQELGPVLFFTSAWDEGNQAVASAETDHESITGTSFRELIHQSTSTWVSVFAGWSMASGANARRVQDSEHRVVLRDRTNVVPVRCYIYCAMSTATGSPTATVRFESQSYSIAEITVPAGTTYAWRSAPGHLRCGIGAQDPVALQVRARCSTASGSPAFRWLYVMIVYADL